MERETEEKREADNRYRRNEIRTHTHTRTLPQSKMDTETKGPPDKPSQHFTGRKAKTGEEE